MDLHMHSRGPDHDFSRKERGRPETSWTRIRRTALEVTVSITLGTGTAGGVIFLQSISKYESSIYHYCTRRLPVLQEITPRFDQL